MPNIELQPGWLRRQTLSAAVSAAWDHLRETKRRMDEAQAVFDRAESDWLEACKEHDRLEEEQQRAVSSLAKPLEKP